MSIKKKTARRFLETNGVQLSAKAISELRDYLNDLCSVVATDVLLALDEENILRRIHGLKPLRRVLARHVKEAVENDQ